MSYAVCALRQKCCSPTELDMKNAHQALRYLKNTKKIGIHLRKTGEPLKAYVDSSWANQVAERKSIYGVILILAGAPISWYAKKSQRVVSSIQHAEYISMDEGTREVLWFQHVAEELSLSDIIPRPVTIYGDNQGAIDLAS